MYYLLLNILYILQFKVIPDFGKVEEQPHEWTAEEENYVYDNPVSYDAIKIRDNERAANVKKKIFYNDRKCKKCHLNWSECVYITFKDLSNKSLPK
jgi:hypothetical protein